MATEIWLNIGPSNGLLLNGTKPLPEPMLTDHQGSPITFIVWITKILFENYMSKISFKFPRGQWDNVPAEDLAPLDARQCAGTVMILSHMYIQDVKKWSHNQFVSVKLPSDKCHIDKSALVPCDKFQGYTCVCWLRTGSVYWIFVASTNQYHS